MWKAELIGGWLPDFGIRQLATDPRPVSVSATGETLEAVLLDRQDSFSFWSSQSVVRPPTQGRGSGIQHRTPQTCTHPAHDFQHQDTNRN